MTRRFPTVALATALLAGAVAGGCDITGPDADVAGSYALETVNAAALPATILQFEEADGTEWSFRVMQGGLEMEGGDYLLSLNVQTREDGVVVGHGLHVWSGSYSVRGSSVTFVDSDGGQGTGTADRDTLSLTIATVEFGELRLVFRR